MRSSCDLVSEPYDLAVRMGSLPDSGLIARKLGSLSRSLYASPDYLVQNGNPGNPDELTDHECIGMRQDKPGHWHLYREESRISIRTSGRFQMNSIGMMRRFASMGAGIAILPDKIVMQGITLLISVPDNRFLFRCVVNARSSFHGNVPLD